METWDERALLLLGDEKLEKLRNAHVLVVGLGGVGGFAAESICRAGVGEMTIVDGDEVSRSNRNRQLVALKTTEGHLKTEVMKERLLAINPELKLNVRSDFMEGQELEDLLVSAPFDMVVDCIDTLTPKVFMILAALRHNLKIVSSMGAGGKFDPMKVQAGDLSDSYNCKLARYVRKRLQKFGVRSGFPVIFSPEDIDRSRVKEEEGRNKMSVIGTISYMPPLFGAYCASVVVRQLTGMQDFYKPKKKKTNKKAGKKTKN